MASELYDNVPEHFPIIKHIDQFRQALEHFRVVFKQKKRPFPYIEKQLLPLKRYAFFNYTFMTVDTFPEIAYGVTTKQEAEYMLIAREMRGVCFDLITGVCVSRGLQKFFNVNERASTKQEVINLNNSHVLLDKADGTMVCSMFVYLDDEDPAKGLKNIRFRSKMGWGTDVSAACIEPFIYGQKVADTNAWPTYYQSDLYDVGTIELKEPGSLGSDARHNYLEFCAKWMKLNYSPIFEYVGPQNRIVLSYPEPKLVLLALRHNFDGSYIVYEEMKKEANAFGIDVTEAHRFPEELEQDPTQRMDRLMTHIKQMEGIEGFVLRFDDGRMYKIKSNWYHELHRTKFNNKIGNNKNEVDIWKAILNNELDDILAEVEFEETRKELNDLNVRLLKAVEAVTNHFDKIVENAMKIYPDRQSFFSNFIYKWVPIVDAGPKENIEKEIVKALFLFKIENKDYTKDPVESDFVHSEEMNEVITVLKKRLAGRRLPDNIRVLLEKVSGEPLVYNHAVQLAQQQEMLKQRTNAPLSK